MSGLGDYGGLPCIMLAAAIARQWVLVLIIAVTSVSVATNYNLVDAPWHMVTAGIVHSNVVMIPFVVFLYSSIKTTRAADRLATRSLEVFFSSSQQAVLRYLHTNFMGYLHDQVINQLRAVSLGITQTRSQSSAGEPSTSDRVAHDLPLSEVIEDWKATFRATHPRAHIIAPQDVPFHASIPGVVATTILEAAVEALSNCATHAPESQPTITVDITDGVSLTIKDHGPGFQLDQVPHDRAGIRIAIVGRMSALPGGNATIDSTLGHGTTVRLSWSAHSPAGLPQFRTPTVQELTGVAALRTPWSALVFFAFTLVISYQFWPTMVWPAYILALLAVMTSLSGVLSGKVPAGTSTSTDCWCIQCGGDGGRRDRNCSSSRALAVRVVPVGVCATVLLFGHA